MNCTDHCNSHLIDSNYSLTVFDQRTGSNSEDVNHRNVRLSSWVLYYQMKPMVLVTVRRAKAEMLQIAHAKLSSAMLLLTQ